MGKGAGGKGNKTRFTLHNNNFDIDFMVSSLMQRFDKLQPETIEVLGQFAERRSLDPFFVVDSLNSVTAKLYSDMAKISGIVTEKTGLGIDNEAINKHLYETFIDRSLREKALLTGERSN